MQLTEGTILAINKPTGISSFGVVARLKKLTGIKRIGHAGTLDPLASGVLVVGIGRSATKQLQASVDAEKEYRVTIRFGATSTTDDAEGQITISEAQRPPDRADIESALGQFVGTIQQTPPNFSAMKIGGRRAYKFARQGQAVVLQPRPVDIKSITIEAFEYSDVRLRVVTGKGAYIRSLARDLGRVLGVGGYVTELERTRIGRWTLAEALDLEAIQPAS